MTTELISFEFIGDSTLDPATRKKHEVIEGIEVVQLLAIAAGRPVLLMRNLR